MNAPFGREEWGGVGLRYQGLGTVVVGSLMLLRPEGALGFVVETRRVFPGPSQFTETPPSRSKSASHPAATAAIVK